MVIDRVTEFMAKDQTVVLMLEEDRSKIVEGISLTFLILGAFFSLFNLINAPISYERLIIGFFATLHGFLGYFLVHKGKTRFANTYFVIGFTFLVVFSIIFWGGVLSFAYPAIFCVVILSMVILGIRGIIFSTISSMSLITVSFVFWELGYYRNYITDFDYVEYYFVQYLIITFAIILLVLQRIIKTNLLFDTKEIKDFMEQMLIYSPDGIVVTDSNWTMIDMNVKFLNITGASKEQFLGHTITEFVQDNAIPKFMAYKHDLDNGYSSNYQSDFINMHGEKIYYDFRGNKLSNGNIIHILRDLTNEHESELEMQKMREVIAENQKMDVVRKIAGNIAHDFNNLLAAIIGYAEVGELTAEDIELFTTIKETAGRGKTLTRRLLTFTKGNQNNPEFIEIDKELHSMQTVLTQIIGSDINIIFDLRANDKGIFMDKGDFEQIVLNIVMNSRDVSISGDNVFITTRYQDIINPLDLPIDRIKQRGESIIELTISDEGGGIKGDPSKIFTPFYTTKSQGTGLGLNIVYNIVEKNDGLIDVKSDEKGTSITMYFPAYSDVIIPTKADNQQSQLPKLKILLVEDEVSVKQTISKVLATKNHSVTAVSNGNQAIEWLKTMNFDLILSDIIMSQSDGFDLLQWIVANEIKTPTLFMTGYANLLDQSNLNMQIMNIIEKPFTLDELELAIQGVISGE